MTNEEARKRLLDWIQYAIDPERVPFMDEPCSDEEIILAMRIGADALSQPSLPSNLDEAAEEFGKRQGLELKPFAKEYFKRGAEWLAGQGETIEGHIAGTNGVAAILAIPRKEYSKGDKVIVQIRKKQ